jgi:FkbM family methyltransferase
MPAPLPPITPGEIDPFYLQELVGEAAPVILEIGANDGLTTLAFLKLFPNARIYAFEPDPRAFAKFKATVTDPRVSVFEMAIGAKDDEAEFHVSSGLPTNVTPEARIKYPEGWDRSGSLRPPKTHKIAWPWVKFEKKIIVQVRRLDSWVRENGVRQIDFIWADIQGAEGDLIAGGTEALARTRFFYTEYSNDESYEGQPNLKKIMDMLPNFNIVHRFKEDVLLKNTAIQSSRT